MIRLLVLFFLVAGGSATTSSLVKTTAGDLFVNDGAIIFTLAHTYAADTTIECLHGSTVLAEVEVAAATGLDTGTTLKHFNELGHRFALVAVSGKTLTLTFTPLEAVDSGVVISCRDKATPTDVKSLEITFAAIMTIAATANPTVPVVGSALEITGAWAGSGTYADTSTIEVTCGSEVTQLAIATVTIDAGGNTFVNQDNENAPVVIGAAEVAGTAIALSGKTIKLTIAKLQQDDLGKMCKFTQGTGDVAVYSIPSPSGAASLTCGFSILLALAVALREFMSG